MPPVQTSISANARATWHLLLAMATAVFVFFSFTGLSVDWRSNPGLLAIMAGFAALTAFYHVTNRDQHIADALLALGQLFLALLLGLLLTYAASVSPFPYVDAQLQKLDEALGIDRETVLSVLRATPFIEWLFDAAYLSIQPQTIIVPFILIALRQIQRLQIFTLAYGLSLVITSAIAIFAPALPAGVFVDLAPHGISQLAPGTYTHVPTLEALRDGSMTRIDLSNLEGLIAFPSFHTANAVLFAWALWSVKYLRWAGIVVNGMMIASTPMSGAHYVIDVLAGSAVALAAIAFAITIAQEATIIEQEKLSELERIRRRNELSM